MNDRDDSPVLLSRVFERRMQQADIRRILDSLSSADRDAFLDSISETLEKFTALMEVSNRLSDSLELDTLFARLVELTTEALRADRGTIFLNDPGTDELFSRIATGEGLTREIRFPNHLGVAGSVFTAGEALIIPDAYADPRFNPEVDRRTGYRTRNILAAPVRDRERRVVGVIQILNKKEGETFAESDLSLLEAMGSQAASALVKARLFEEVVRARREEAELFEVTRAISSEIQLLPLIQKIIATAVAMLECDRGTLFLNDSRRGELWSMVASGMGMQEIRLPNHVGIAGHVFTSGEVTNIADAYADPRFNPEVDRKSGYRTETILCMPVVNKQEERIGVIQLLNKSGGPFDAKDEARVAAFSAQAAIALENAKLFQDVLNMRNYNESILESMTNGLITLNERFLIEKCNSAALRILRLPGDDLLDRDVGDLFPGRENGWVRETAARVLETGRPDSAMDQELTLAGGSTLSVNMVAVPLAGEEGGTLGALLVIEDISSEKRLKGTLARYMTKEVAEQLLDDPRAMLGGQVKEATVFFSDIRSFTTLSESLGARETVSMLNDYFTEMVDVLFHHQGILDKYIGDAIMAVFGTPFSTGRDADNALCASIEMMRKLRELNARRVKEGKPAIEIGIGLNTAEVLVGNIGSLKRMDYTVIGDGVNLASRLESANKYYGSSILLSEFTRERLEGDYILRPVDRIRVKGKTEPVAIYEALDFHTRTSFPFLEDQLERFERGLTRYLRADFSGALEQFDAACRANPSDRLARLYADRCRQFLENPPAPDWAGVWIMATK
jgi:adenylate cyclase